MNEGLEEPIRAPLSTVKINNSKCIKGVTFVTGYFTQLVIFEEPFVKTEQVLYIIIIMKKSTSSGS